jgi:hypothetical protein
MHGSWGTSAFSYLTLMTFFSINECKEERRGSEEEEAGDEQ